MPALNTIKLRRGTAAAWISANPVLSAGEPGIETDTGKMKIGDGSTTWNSLSYIANTATPVDGWIDDTGETWTYASADGHTFTFTVSGDQTAKYTPGVRIKLTQTTVKYFIVTKVSVASGTTTVTIYGGTDYTLANAAISANYHSREKAPAGFSLDPSKWTETFDGSSGPGQTNPSNGTWYNLGSYHLDIPIGCWHISYRTQVFTENNNAGNYCSTEVALSSSTTSVSDDDLRDYHWAHVAFGSTGSNGFMWVAKAYKTLTLAAKTTYSLIATPTDTGIAHITFRDFEGGHTIIKAECAYL